MMLKLTHYLKVKCIVKLIFAVVLQVESLQKKLKLKKDSVVTPANFAGIMREAHLCQQVIKSLEAAFSSKGQSSVLMYQELSPSKTHSLCLSQGQRGIRKTYIAS